MSVLKMFGYNEAAASKPDQVYPLGVMHYKRKKPGAVAFRVVPMNPAWSQPAAEKGLENTKFLELDHDGYAAFVRAYIASSGDLGEGFMHGFKFIANHAVNGDSKNAKDVYTRFPDLESGRLKRAIHAGTRISSELDYICAGFELHQDIFTQAIEALTKMEQPERLTFLNYFVLRTALAHNTQKQPVLLAQLANVLCAVFPTTANAASATLAVESADLTSYKTSSQAYIMLVQMFEQNAQKSMSLPSDFSLS